ncbi:hypothetical protein L6164_013210 [Bauhinia variegata]|uniref:Uncharacterized protein n=1 Tax=Bauhinia variegata TaxID=167791 RepID=A0ACB9PBW8_BAUVA|nr:hypothetical protein L6164_013210 [Bauhinia variegata]
MFFFFTPSLLSLIFLQFSDPEIKKSKANLKNLSKIPLKSLSPLSSSIALYLLFCSLPSSPFRFSSPITALFSVVSMFCLYLPLPLLVSIHAIYLCASSLNVVLLFWSSLLHLLPFSFCSAAARCLSSRCPFLLSSPSALLLLLAYLYAALCTTRMRDSAAQNPPRSLLLCLVLFPFLWLLYSLRFGFS